MSYVFGGKFQVIKLKDGGQERLRLAVRYRNAPDEFLHTGEDEKPP